VDCQGNVRNLDFTSWQALLSTLLGLSLITVIGVGIRLLAMQTIQQRRERENRQINERLRTLIAAYKTLGGSFTGDLAVDPAHLRDLKREADGVSPGIEGSADGANRSDRSRRIRDAVEAALSDSAGFYSPSSGSSASSNAADNSQTGTFARYSRQIRQGGQQGWREAECRWFGWRSRRRAPRGKWIWP
jgi:hypothetical protein